MSRINTNVNALVAGRVLNQQNKSLQQSLERLSTGLAINRGADDPAGLIGSEKLRSEKAAISAAIGNAERAEQVVNIAEGGLQEISSLLVELQDLVTSSANEAGLSAEEKEANQLQIDSILSTIDRIAGNTSFQGTKLLNGNYDFVTTGVNTARVSEFSVNALNLQHNTSRNVSVAITNSAQHGALYLSTGGPLNLGGATSSFIIEIGGSKGSREFSFGSGTTVAVIISAVNSFSSVTGVSAASQSTGVVLKSQNYGSDEFVTVNVIDEGGIAAGAIHNLSSNAEGTIRTASTTAFAVGASVRDQGQDVAATINGLAADGKGDKLRARNDELDISITLTATGATTLGNITAFTVTDGGAAFNVGPEINTGNQVRLGIGDVSSRKLGTKALGFLDELGSGKTLNVVDGNLEDAQKVVNAAIDKVSSLRGRLGAVQKNTIGASIRSLGVALENTSAAESSIRDTDFAAETAKLTRSQILAAAATNTLAIANAQPQSVLQLIG